MAFSAKVLADSVSPDNVRLTTLEVTMPRVVLSEFNTHRVFSRNSASSRAIPVEKRIAAVEADPFVPEAFGKNKKGMQASEDLTDNEARVARDEWLSAMRSAVSHAKLLAKLGVHKQLANRLIEPWVWQTVIVSATEWDNFWGLRCNPDAQPEIRKAAELMRDAYNASFPRPVDYGDWHLPLVEPAEAFDLQVNGMSIDDICKVSIGRCARVSYLTHDGRRDPKADIELANRLSSSGHNSPFEHVARPMTLDDAENVLHRMDRGDIDVTRTFCGNFCGWIQYRKLLPFEANFLARPKS